MTASSEPAEVVAELRLTRLNQLFDSLDPSPFQERDLDRNAASYVERWFADEPLDGRPFALRVRLPADELARSGPIQDAVQNHFAREQRLVEQDLRTHWRDARLALLFGVAFVAACFAGARFLASLSPSPWMSTVADGLVILGWIALWRPGEMILYDWIPLARRRKLYRKLAAMRVETLSVANENPS